MISPKQKKILAFPFSEYDAIICDGTIRTGKTSIMTVAFIDWAMQNFSGQRFGICGKTVDSATKNIITPYIVMTYAQDKYRLKWRRTDKLLEVKRGAVTNWFEVFGGKDESSFALIQGRTLAGVLLDEVALMPESFVNQALARCSVDGARLWFSCNPDSPEHWFKKQWIDRHRERNALYLHFQLEDNPSLSPKTVERYKSMYSGVFYQRYILGVWTQAEGLVYPMFDKELHTTDVVDGAGDYYISIDYGTINPTVFQLWKLKRDRTAVMVKEYCHNSRETKVQKTDAEYYNDLADFAGNLPILKVIVDPSAASFKECIKRSGRFKVLDADNSVIDGIRYTGTLLNEGRLKVHPSCSNTIHEFGAYRWDEKSPKDAVIKESDHSMDAMRYFAYTLRRKFREETQPMYL